MKRSDEESEEGRAVGVAKNDKRESEAATGETGKVKTTSTESDVMGKEWASNELRTMMEEMEVGEEDNEDGN